MATTVGIKYNNQLQSLSLLALCSLFLVVENAVAIQPTSPIQPPSSMEYSIYIIGTQIRNNDHKIDTASNCESVLERLQSNDTNSTLEATDHEAGGSGPSVSWFKKVNIGYIAMMNKLAAQKIESLEEVEFVEEDTEVEATSLPEWAWHLDRIDQTHPPLDHAYRTQYTGNGVDVYIVDSGIRYSHITFGGRARFGGYDSTGGQGEDCSGHGTHVAALAAGNQTGSAPKAGIYSIKTLRCVGYRTVGNLCHLIEGLSHTIDQIKKNTRPAVISMSLIVHAGSSKSLDAATQRANQEGIPVVVAAGNFFQDACRYSPGASNVTITVGGTHERGDKLYVNTNFGDCVDIFAPGQWISSASHLSDTGIVSKSGTSMATPIVSGVVAMLLEEDPALTPEQVKEELIKRATKDVLDFRQLPKDGQQSTPNRLVYAGNMTPKKGESQMFGNGTAVATATIKPEPTAAPVPALPNIPSSGRANLTLEQLRFDISLQRNGGFVPTNINSYTSSHRGTPVFTVVYTYVGQDSVRSYYVFTSQRIEDLKRKLSFAYWSPVTFALYEMPVEETRALLVMKIGKSNHTISTEKTLEQFQTERDQLANKNFYPVIVRYRTFQNNRSEVFTIYQKANKIHAVFDAEFPQILNLLNSEKSLQNYVRDITYHITGNDTVVYTAIFDHGPSQYQATSQYVDVRSNLWNFRTVSAILRKTLRHLVALVPLLTTHPSGEPGYISVYWK